VETSALAVRTVAAVGRVAFDNLQLSTRKDIMDRTGFRPTVLHVIGFIAVTSSLLTAQESPTTGTPVHMVVTAEARHGADVPVIQKDLAVNSSTVLEA
jgi:hypothetical protein